MTEFRSMCTRNDQKWRVIGEFQAESWQDAKPMVYKIKAQSTNGFGVVRSSIEVRVLRFGVWCWFPHKELNEYMDSVPIHPDHHLYNWDRDIQETPFVDNSLKIPMPVYMSRLSVTPETPGDQFAWEIGETAWWTDRHGSLFPVVIDSGMVGHVAAPGDQCYEVLFPMEENLRQCVSAKQLRIRS